MTAIEDRLRAATKAIARTVADDSAPPLQLPVTGQTPDRGRMTPLRLPTIISGRRRSLPGVPARRWLPAAAAVVAVLAVAAVLVVLAGLPRPTRPTGAGPLAQLPPYYVALQRIPGPAEDPYRDEAVVRSTVSGRDVAIVAGPKGYEDFGSVSGSDSGLTFVLSAGKPSNSGVYPASKLYLLRVWPSARPGHRAVLTPLPAAALPDGDFATEVALSPDGRMLAVVAAAERYTAPEFALEVYNLVTGAHRSWANPGGWMQVSWAADDRMLALQGPELGHLKLLDTAAPGTSIAVNGRAVTLRTRPGTQLITGSFPSIESSFGSGTMTADGEHVLEIVSSRRQLSGTTGGRRFGLDALDLRTGTITRLLRQAPIYLLLWSNGSGSAALVTYAPFSDPLNTPLKDLIKPTYAILRSARASAQLELPPATFEVAW